MVSLKWIKALQDSLNFKCNKKFQPDFLCEFGKLLLDPLGVSLQELIVGVVQRLLRGQLVVDRQPELLLFQELDFGDKIGELLKYVRY